MTTRLSLAQNSFDSLVDHSRDFFWIFHGGRCCSASQTTAEFGLCVVRLRTNGNKMETISPQHPLKP
jgi:hypothetical protein